MSEEKTKSITVQLDGNTHRDLKIKIAKEGVTLKEYVVKLIKDDLKKGGN